MCHVNVTGGPVEDYARFMVSSACRGENHVKFPSWYDIFLLYRVFAPDLLSRTFRMLLATNGARRTSLVGTGKPLLEGSPPRKLLTAPNVTFSNSGPLQMQKLERESAFASDHVVDILHALS